MVTLTYGNEAIEAIDESASSIRIMLVAYISSPSARDGGDNADMSDVWSLWFLDLGRPAVIWPVHKRTGVPLTLVRSILVRSCSFVKPISDGDCKDLLLGFVTGINVARMQ
jgi:hypothetical protein